MKADFSFSSAFWLGADAQGGNFTFRRGEGRIPSMQDAKIITKPPMPPVEKVAAGSSIGFGRRDYGGKPYAVRRAEKGRTLHMFFGKKSPDDLAFQLGLKPGARFVVRDKSLTDSAAMTQGTQASLRTI